MYISWGGKDFAETAGIKHNLYNDIIMVLLVLDTNIIDPFVRFNNIIIV